MLNVPSKERFRLWLERKPADEVVAQAWDFWSCPVCLFLKTEGWTKPSVMGADAGRLVGDYDGDILIGAAPAPDWVRSFAYWADQCVERRLTAEECLFLLDIPYFNRNWKP